MTGEAYTNEENRTQEEVLQKNQKKSKNLFVLTDVTMIPHLHYDTDMLI